MPSDPTCNQTLVGKCHAIPSVRYMSPLNVAWLLSSKITLVHSKIVGCRVSRVDKWAGSWAGCKLMYITITFNDRPLV